jgi:hypothetical protein
VIGDTRYGDYSIFDIRNVAAPDQVPVGDPIDVTVDVAFGDRESPETWTDTVELVNDGDGSVVDSATISADPFKETTVTLTRTERRQLRPTKRRRPRATTMTRLTAAVTRTTPVTDPVRVAVRMAVTAEATDRPKVT